MYLHIVMMSFSAEVTAAFRAQLENSLHAVRRECEGVVRFDLVDNHSRTSAAYSHALLSVFTDLEALDSYRTGAAHDRLMAEIGLHIREIVVLDSVLEKGQLP